MSESNFDSISQGVSNANSLMDFADALFSGDFESYRDLAADQIVGDALENIVGKTGARALGLFGSKPDSINIADTLSRNFSVNYSDMRDLAYNALSESQALHDELSDAIGDLYSDGKISVVERNSLYTDLSQAKTSERQDIVETLGVLAEHFPNIVAELVEKTRRHEKISLLDYHPSNVTKAWSEAASNSPTGESWGDAYGSLDGYDGGNSFGKDSWDKNNDGWPDYSFSDSTGYSGGIGDPDVDQGYTGDGPEYDGPKPIIMDLDNNGIEVSTARSVLFDVDDDEYLELMSWTSGNDGFLVLDLNSDGSRGLGDEKIDQAKELIFALWGEEGDTDLEALRREFDNGDGILNSEDGVWDELRIWQDLDQNGETDLGELRTLAEWNITQINLAYDDASGYEQTSDDITLFGNTLHGLATYTKDGQVISGGVGDVSLSASEFGYRWVETNSGYAIELETGERYSYRVLDDTGSQTVNLVQEWLDGAFGDERANFLTAAGHVRSVQIDGGMGSDTVVGGQMDDMLSGGAGADSLEGGGGNDVVFFDKHDISVIGGSGHDVAIFVDEESGSVHHLDFDLKAKGFEAAFGGKGNDTLDAGYAGYAAELHGGDGGDLLKASYTDDLVSGDKGDDTVWARAGDDIVIGGDGNDVLNGDNGSDLLFGNSGNDSLNGGEGDDYLSGGEGSDSLWGSIGDDQLNGNDDDDDVKGYHGDDTLYGGDGADILEGNDGDDALYGGSGNDTIHNQSGDDYVEGGEGNDYIVDGAGDDVMRGGDGNDRIQLYTYSGNNVVQGGKGTDTLVLNGVADMWEWEYVQTPRQVQIGVTEGHDGSEEPVYTTVQAGKGQYLFWSGDTYIQVQDVERVEFKGTGNQTYWSHLDMQSSAEFALSYVASHNDLITAIGRDADDATIHWMNYGLGSREVTFNALKYLAANRDVYNTWGFDLAKSAEHYIHWGRDAGRNKGDFDAEQYLRNYGDLRNAFGTDLSAATRHFVQHGFGEGRTDNALTNSMSMAAWNNWLADNGEGVATVLLDNVSASEDNQDLFYWASHRDETDPNAVIYGYAGTANDIEAGHGNDTVQADNTGHWFVIDTPHPTMGMNDTVDGGDGSDSIQSGAGDDSVSGGSGADLILGEVGNDLLEGGSGADIIRGGDGHDTINGLDGADILEGNELSDVLNGGAGNDLLRGGAGNDSLIGSTGSDQLFGDEGNDTLHGNDGSDTLTGGDSRDHLFGGNGSDLLIGDAGADTLDGGLGDDRLQGGTQNDSLGGGAGNDYLEGGAGSDILTGDIGQDVIFGDDGADTISGNDDNDILYGGAGSDQLYGGAENDILNGGTGGDYLDGGDGVDAVSYADASGGVALQLRNVDQSNFSGEAFGDVYVSIENAYGSDHNDFLHGSHSHNTIWGAKGADRIYGHDGNDALFGGDDNDTLFGHTGKDQLFGEDGTDELFGGNGDDTLIGGVGSDKLSGEAGNDILRLSQSTDGELDTLNGGDGIDTADFSSFQSALWVDLDYADGHEAWTKDLHDAAPGAADWREIADLENIENLTGTGYDDHLVGDDGQNALSGNEGDDRLEGGRGSDLLKGDKGDDTIFTGAGFGDDTAYGGDGNDLIEGSNGKDLLYGEAGNDTLSGGNDTATADQDTLYGGAGNDYLSSDQIETPVASAQHLGDLLFGGTGNDTLVGGLADDVIHGGANHDSIEGGDGNDIIFTGTPGTTGDAGNDQAHGGNGNDSMIGSNGQDTLFGNAGNDTLDGGDDWKTADVDNLFGGTGNDLLISGQTTSPQEGYQSKGDKLYGEAGNDTLVGGLADDRLEGGSGADTFVFDNDFGSDLISDFSLSQPGEKIDLSAVTSITSFSDLSTNHLDQNGANAVIHDGFGNIIVLSGVNKTGLVADDFIF